MDSHLYDYAGIVKHDTLKWLFDSMEKVKRFHVSIDWHQRVINNDYGWHVGFNELLAEMKRRYG